MLITAADRIYTINTQVCLCIHMIDFIENKSDFDKPLRSKKAWYWRKRWTRLQAERDRLFSLPPDTVIYETQKKKMPRMQPGQCYAYG